MPKEKRNNLAIYTLAGSILLSSVIVSMNQSNAHTKDTSKIDRVAKCVDTNFFYLSQSFKGTMDSRTLGNILFNNCRNS
jgi:hypothetical protein